MKKIIIFFLLFSFLVASNLNLTKEEKEYLKKNSVIKVCINPDWTPIEFRDKNGNPQGISIDILKILAKELNLKLKFIKTSSWLESQKFLKEKKCDILPTAVITDERKKYAIFTKPYLSYGLVVITTNDKPLINNLEEIVDKTMVRKKGSGLISKMKKLYPNIKIVQPDNFCNAFKLVNDRKVYFTIATIPVFEYYKRRYHFNNLSINGYTNFRYNLRMMIRDDKPILRNILDKALTTTITPKIKKEIYNKWAINVRAEIEYKKYLCYMGIILLIVVLFFLYQTFYLKKKIKEATKKIEEKNAKFKKMLDNAMEAVIITDEDFIIVDGNKRAEDMFGYSRAEVLGKSLLMFIPENEREELINVEEILEPIERIRTRKDGTKIFCLITRTSFFEEGKKYRVSMIVDITKFKEQEEMLAQHSKSVAMGEMIGNIAHQWRQPLNALSLYINNLVLDYEFGELNDEKMKEFQTYTTKLIQKMNETINDFTQFLKPDKQKKEFSLLESINETLEFVSASYKVNNIKVENNIKIDIKIYGIKSELEEVFMNILNNSKDAFKERNIKDRKVIISAEENEDEIIITFRDNAGGVDEKIINRLTEPYFSTKFASQGTGLGLYMSEMILEKTFNGQLVMKNVDGGLETKIILKKEKNKK